MSLIEFIKLCLLGIVQGVTEPLPISSSAHMLLLTNILNLNNSSISLEILLNFASTIAIFCFFSKKIFILIKASITNKENKNYPYLNRSFLLKILIASIPIIITGFLFKDFVNKYLLSTITISISLLATSLMLYIIYLMLSKKKIFTEEITIIDSLVIGLYQSLAIIPGVSRSGSVLFGGIKQNTKLKVTMDFSFFLYLIASIGSLTLSIIDSDFTNLINSFNISSLIIVFLLTFVISYISIILFYKIINKRTILVFSFYAFTLGIIFLILNIFKH